MGDHWRFYFNVNDVTAAVGYIFRDGRMYLHLYPTEPCLSAATFSRRLDEHVTVPELFQAFGETYMDLLVGHLTKASQRLPDECRIPLYANAANEEFENPSVVPL